MSDLIKETLKNYNFREDGEYIELSVATPEEKEKDFYIRDFTQDEKLINAIESQDSVMTYTEYIYDELDNYKETLNELNINVNDLEDGSSSKTLVFNMDSTEVFAVIEMFYVPDAELGFKAKVTSLLK